MPYKLSRKAEKDFEAIYRYTFIKFGELQADNYTSSLENCFSLLSENPYIGCETNYLSEGLYRHLHEQHIIFYRVRKTEIFVVRLLHESMDVPRHLS